MSIAYCPPYKRPNNTCSPNLRCNMSQPMSTSKLLEHTFQVQCSRVLHIIFFTIRISKKTKFVVTHWNHQTVQQLQSLITMTWTRQPTTTLIFYSPKIAWLKVSIARNHKSSSMSSYLATKFEQPPTASSEAQYLSNQRYNHILDNHTRPPTIHNHNVFKWHWIWNMVILIMHRWGNYYSQTCSTLLWFIG